MELQFLGRGAAFNPKEGNNSAYFIEDNQLFLIDCGESVFARIVAKDLLSGMDNINLLITHTHSDHIGSLGSLVMYSYYTLGKPINIIMKKSAKHLPNIKKILTGFGCTPKMYKFVAEEDYDNKFTTFQALRYIETNHCVELNSYGILFTTTKGLVYYSGDTRDLEPVKKIIESKQSIDKLYIEVSTENFPGTAHLYIEILKEQIPPSLRSKVYCMHFNNDECIERARTAGFNVVEIKK